MYVLASGASDSKPNSIRQWLSVGGGVACHRSSLGFHSHPLFVLSHTPFGSSLAVTCNSYKKLLKSNDPASTIVHLLNKGWVAHQAASVRLTGTLYLGREKAIILGRIIERHETVTR
jgi:hypothetical protein